MSLQSVLPLRAIPLTSATMNKTNTRLHLTAEATGSIQMSGRFSTSSCSYRRFGHGWSETVQQKLTLIPPLGPSLLGTRITVS